MAGPRVLGAPSFVDNLKFWGPEYFRYFIEVGGAPPKKVETNMAADSATMTLRLHVHECFLGPSNVSYVRGTPAGPK